MSATSEHSFDGTHRPTGTVEDMRGCERLDRTSSALLIGWGGVDPIPCTVRNLSSSGMFVHAADVPELGVGRRYEVVVDSGATGGELSDLLGEGCYATVIRTEFVDEEGHRRVGAGLRFDHPIPV